MVYRMYLYRYIEIFNEECCKKREWIFLFIFSSALRFGSDLLFLASKWRQTDSRSLHRLRGQDSLRSTVLTTDCLLPGAWPGGVSSRSQLPCRQANCRYSGWHLGREAMLCLLLLLIGLVGVQTDRSKYKNLSSDLLGMSGLVSVFFWEVRYPWERAFL